MFSPGQQALPLSYFVNALLLDDEEEAAELCALYNLPLEQQGGNSVAVINKVRHISWYTYRYNVRAM